MKIGVERNDRHPATTCVIEYLAIAGSTHAKLENMNHLEPALAKVATCSSGNALIQQERERHAATTGKISSATLSAANSKA